MLQFLKAPFVVLHFSYYTLMTFLIIVSVTLLSMLMILLFIVDVIKHLICGNNLNRLLNWNLIYKTLWTGVRSGLLNWIVRKLSWFHLTGVITIVLLMWKWMSLFLRKNHLLRCWGWPSLLNWIGHSLHCGINAPLIDCMIFVLLFFCYLEDTSLLPPAKRKSNTQKTKNVLYTQTHKNKKNVLTKTNNNLKPPETIWNHLKLPTTTQKFPETTWNQRYYSIFT